MTVGIAAAYDDPDNPAVVVVADRRVTTGEVEHEHADGKLETVSVGDPAVAAVAAGTLAYADEVYFRAGNKILSEDPDTVQGVGELFVESMHEIVRDEANNQILADYNITLRELTMEGTALSDSVVRELLTQVNKLKENIQGGTNILLAGVDGQHGAQILELRGGSLTRHTSLGYQCIGSGERSARLTFMRRGYDPGSLEEALLLAAEGKSQAGEAQGVGDEMDVGVVDNRVEFLSEQEVSNIQSLIDEVQTAEQAARESTITDADPILDR